MKRVKEIMTKGTEIASPDDSVRDVARRMEAGNIGMLPISENERLIGTVTDRDIVVRVVSRGDDVNNTRIRDAMSEGVVTVSDEDSVDDVADRMGRDQIRRALVVNTQKELVGTVALADLAMHVRDDSTVAGALRGVSAG